MAVTVMCPNLTCRATLRVPDEVRGKKVRCAQCGTVFHVPSRPRTPTATTPPGDPDARRR